MRLRHVGLLGLLALAGCRSAQEGEQTALCRTAAVALFDTPRLAVTAETALPANSLGQTGWRIDAMVPGSPNPLWIECRFGPVQTGEPPDLVGLATPDGPLSDPRLLMLKRFWLASPDAAAADPVLVQRERGLPDLPMPLAYALQQLLSALPNAAVYSLLAAAYSLVYGLFGRINLAFGEIAATGGFAAFAGAAFFNDRTSPAALLAALALGLWSAAVHGVAIERWVLWPLRGATGQQGLVATVGLALFLQEYLRLATGDQSGWIPPILSEPLRLAKAEHFVVTVTPIALVLAAGAFAASLAVLWLLAYTGFGRSWRATADDAGAAALFGVDPKRLSMQTFGLACGLAGLAGAGVTVYYGSIGVLYTTTLGLKALIAAIVGGIGSVRGAFLGGLMIALVEAGWSAYFPIVYRDLIVDMMLVAVLVFRPGGLFGFGDLLPRRV